MRRRARQRGFLGFRFGSGACGAWTPGRLALTGWFRAPYTSGASWSGTASLGSSGSNNLGSVAGTPTAGTAQNGYAPADFDDASTDGFTSSVATNVWFGTGAAFGGWVLLQLDTNTSTRAVIGPTSPSGVLPFSLTVASGNLVLKIQEQGAGLTRTATIACGTAAYHLFQFRCDGSTKLEVRIDGGSWTTVTATNGINGNSAPTVGSTGTTNSFDGRILEMGFAATAFDDTTFNQIRNYINNRYGLSI